MINTGKKLMTQWNSLFCLLDNPVDELQNTLTHLDYTLYNAFDLIPGKSYTDTFKTFIFPANGRWTQIIVDDETDIEDLETLAEALSNHGLCLLVQLDNQDEAVQLYDGGDEAEFDMLTDYLLDGKSADDLSRALDGKLPLPLIESPADEQSQILAINDLPDDMRQMAQGLKPSGAQNMFQRFSRNFMGGDDASRAQELLNADILDWNSEGGMVIRGVLSCLIAGDNWLAPDFTTVRDAYQRHIRLERRPNAKLYPGDQQMMDAVPNALEYTPVYGGQ